VSGCACRGKAADTGTHNNNVVAVRFHLAYPSPRRASDPRRRDRG
jgi:hypothetical protein